MGYSVEVSVNKSESLAKIIKHSSPADSAEMDWNESSGLFEFLTSLDAIKKAILDEASEGEKKIPAKKTSVDSSDEEDEKQRLKFIQTFDMLYPEEALFQMENVSVRTMWSVWWRSNLNPTFPPFFVAGKLDHFSSGLPTPNILANERTTVL